ncbi:hypothetical protein GWI33_021091 [Rhynchophorus ferrugineus]|uniref:ER membrane protein complex subunit 10 n=1 Tax=Rhynchophorus ferrugineus TaxID=354439 RepID=A0A834HR07_RHYFE|nr:hypothetical protein GWI33_021091 [Rhynchophorus ferrugineus]
MKQLLIFCLLVWLFINYGNCIEHDSSVVINLKHALSGGPNPVFKDRGTITIPSLRLSQAVVHQKRLTDVERIQIQKLANDNDLYRINATVIANDEIERSFISTIKACMLAEAELDDRLSVSVDYMGRVIGVSLVIASKATCEGSNVSIDKLGEFTTNVYVRHTETGIIPDTATYIDKLQKEKEAKERDDHKDNRSFLAKYWIYIVPVVIVMVISSATNPEAQGGGQ